MSVIGSNILAGASGQAGYNLTKSLRFRSSASAYLNRTPSVTGNRRTWTSSLWFKRGTLGVAQILLGATGSSRATYINLNASNQLQIYSATSAGGGDGGEYITTQVFRDTSAWYHLVIAYDSTQATSTERIKLWVNGQQVTSFATSTAPTLNHDTQFNWTGAVMDLGRYSTSFYIDGYLAEVNFIDGQALTPSSFGETSTSTGVWIPKKYTGTYGTNGFYLPFTDTTSTSTLGTDFSGNSNTWTVNNISLTAGSTYDSMNDVPTLTSTTTANYAVLNPLQQGAIVTANGNLNATGVGTNYDNIPSTIAFDATTTSGFYAEFTSVSNDADTVLGICAFNNASLGVSNSGFPFAYYADGYGLRGDGDKKNNNTNASYGVSWTNGDVISIAVKNGKLYFAKNGTWMNSGNLSAETGYAYSGITGQIVFALAINGTFQFNANFGQRPFSYTPPTGFVALNTFNLPTPTIGATASSQAITYMGATTYSGDSTSNRVITTGGGSDFVWIKRRNSTTNNILFDVLRGAGATLYSNLTNAEVANGSYYVQTFGNTSFTLGTGGDAADNITGGTYVAWNWKANGAGVSNTQGSITSTVSANTTAGFSIVTYSIASASATISTFGHGLGVAPSMVILKVRNAVDEWTVYHSSIPTPNSNWLTLNTTNAAGGATSTFSSSSSTFGVRETRLVGSGSSGNVLAYCFAPVAGYSAFGSYTGNGSTDGAFVYLGFRPKFILWKNASSTYSWYIVDTTRWTYNAMSGTLAPNTSSAEDTAWGAGIFDILSNGFKVRTSSAETNGNAWTFIYMAFAENPFKYANAR